jgi:hypothetical protein
MKEYFQRKGLTLFTSHAALMDSISMDDEHEQDPNMIHGVDLPATTTTATISRRRYYDHPHENQDFEMVIRASKELEHALQHVLTMSHTSGNGIGGNDLSVGTITQPQQQQQQKPALSELILQAQRQQCFPGSTIIKDMFRFSKCKNGYLFLNVFNHYT